MMRLRITNATVVMPAAVDRRMIVVEDARIGDVGTAPPLYEGGVFDTY